MEAEQPGRAGGGRGENGRRYVTRSSCASPVSLYLGQCWDWPPVKTLKYVSRVLLEVVVTLFAERLCNLCNIRNCGPQTSSVRIPSLGNLLEVQVPKPHPRTLESETLGVGPAIVLSSCPATLILTRFENHCPKAQHKCQECDQSTFSNPSLFSGSCVCSE